MSIYKYSESKLIDEVTFKKTERGAVRAYLHATEATPQNTIRTMIHNLRAEDWECIPFNLDGKPVIEVRGFKREEKLLKFLGEHKWIEGKSNVIPDVTDEIGWKDKLKKRSLQAGGALYAVGDVSFFMYGLKGSSPLDMAAGCLYGLPTPVLLKYGRNDQSEIQIKDMAKEMAKHFRTQSAKLPDDCSLESLTVDQKKGIVLSAEEFLQRFPSEFMNLCYAGAGACIFAAGMKHLNAASLHGAPEAAIEGWLKNLQKTQPLATREMAATMALKNIKTENYLNLGVGGMTVASGLFGTLVKEKAHDPDEAHKTGLAGMWEWVRERPLAVTGVGFMVSTLLHAASTMVAIRGQDAVHKKAVPWRAAFVMSALLAELMVAISSKGHGDGVVSDVSVDESTVAIAADMIVKQPKALQNALIEHMGAFLGRPDVLAVKDQDATTALRQQVEIMRKNPWACAENDPPTATQSASTETTVQGKDAAAVAPWKTKILQTSGSQPQTQPLA